eukprot:TRINITY_DN5128_c0_g1_i2.p1 TRINITY_DN5128_c0_g1~~TRINITY_DN5128_c0_g1_i2.p1  ORF type:complete len:173 (-),score=23.34 TRINITY_DN5128_c0_g1_i2:105-623(-)
MVLNSFLKFMFEGTPTARPFYLSQSRPLFKYGNLAHRLTVKCTGHGQHPYFEKSADINVKGSAYFVLRPLNPILLPFARYRLDTFRNNLKQLLVEYRERSTTTRSITATNFNVENQTENFVTEREYSRAETIDKTGHLGRVPPTYSWLMKAKNAVTQVSILALESLYRPVVF